MGYGRTGGAAARRAPVARAGRRCHVVGIGWDARRLRDGRTFLAPEVVAVAGIADALEDIHACHREILAAALARAAADGTLPDVVPARDAFAIHAVVLRLVEMRARGRLDRSYPAVRDEVVRLFISG